MMKPFKEALAEELMSELSKEEIESLPSGYQRVGDVLILSLQSELKEHRTLIGKTTLRIVPNVRTVCEKTGAIHGAIRLPEVEFITGDPCTVTVHKENDCLFKLDVSEVMFAKGNITERARIAQQVGQNEIVVDMFAGIGYFSIPIAVLAKPAHVYSLEINPTSFEFLEENIKLNEVEETVIPLLGDCRDLAAQLADVADRVVMGYLPGTHEFLPAAFQILNEHRGIIHYHDVFHESKLFEKPIELLKKYSEQAGYQLRQVLTKREVKSYAPRQLHVVLDVEFAGNNG